MRPNRPRAICVAALTSLALAAPAAALADDTPNVDLSSPAAAVAALRDAGDLNAGAATGKPDADSAAVTEANNSVVDAPKDPQEGVAVSNANGQQVGLGIPNAASALPGVRTREAVLYNDPITGAVTAVQALQDGSTRLNIEIPNSDAPHDYAVPLRLPDGYAPRKLDDGSVAVSNADGDTIGVFSAPIAKDANGNFLPTSFTVDGSTVTQHIDFDSSTAFPIVADHWWNTAWHVAKCGAAIGGFIAGNLFLVAKVRKIGGVVRLAKILVATENWERRYKAALAAFGDITGLGAVVSACG